MKSYPFDMLELNIFPLIVHKFLLDKDPLLFVNEQIFEHPIKEKKKKKDSYYHFPKIN